MQAEKSAPLTDAERSEVRVTRPESGRCGTRFLVWIWILKFGFSSILPPSRALAGTTATWNWTASEPISNGSFEAGDSEPAGWRLYAEGSWSTTSAHRGALCITGASRTESLICESQSVTVRSDADYRLDGWVRCASGVARLGVDFLDAQGRVAARQEAPPVRAGPALAGWRYVATELGIGKGHRPGFTGQQLVAPKATEGRSPGTPHDSPSTPLVRVRVWFRVQGRADLDDVALTPTAVTCLANKALQPDERGRIPFWNEEKDNALLPGRRGGGFSFDPKVERERKPALLLAPSADWFALSSLNYGVAPWTERYELSLWARCDARATAQILACWTDDRQNVVRVDTGAASSHQTWHRLCLSLEAPPHAFAVRLIAAARSGRVWFGEAELLRLAPRQPRLRIFVNQVGYDLAGSKTAVVASNFLPPGHAPLKFALVTPAGQTVWKQQIRCAGRIYDGTTDDRGWYFWRADFSSWQGPGQFSAHAQWGQARGHRETL